MTVKTLSGDTTTIEVESFETIKFVRVKTKDMKISIHVSRDEEKPTPG